jgi:uncharacterized protein (TIGR02594 family)
VARRVTGVRAGTARQTKRAKAAQVRRVQARRAHAHRTVAAREQAARTRVKPRKAIRARPAVQVTRAAVKPDPVPQPKPPAATLATGTSPPKPRKTGVWAPIIAEARRYLGTNPTSMKRLWCARFMNMVLERTGHKGTGSDWARSFAQYGQRISAPQVGAIAVLSRGKRGGHVGVVTSVDRRGNPILISGNHNRRVAVARYPRHRIIAYVLPVPKVSLAEAQEAEMRAKAVEKVEAPTVVADAALGRFDVAFAEHAETTALPRWSDVVSATRSDSEMPSMH